jgi:hypothetical protein
MPTADEARAELARRELARRAAARGEGRGKPSLYLDAPAPRANVDMPPKLNRGALEAFRPSRPNRGPNSQPQASDAGRRATRDRPGLAPRLRTVEAPLSIEQQVASSLSSFEGGFRGGTAGLLDALISGAQATTGKGKGVDAPFTRAFTDPESDYIPLNATDRVAAGAGRNTVNALMPGGAFVRALSVAGPAIGGEGFRSLADMAGADETGQAVAEFGGNIVGSVPAAVASAPAAARGVVAARPGPPRIRADRPPTRGDSVRLLREIGTDMTPGQRVGGMAKTLEDLLQRVPGPGWAIRGARDRGNQSFVAAVTQDALQPIGGRISPTTGIGAEMVADAQAQIGAHLDNAAAAIPQIAPNREFAEGLWGIRQGLPARLQGKFDEVLATYLDPALLNSGTMTGAQLRTAESRVNEAARSGLRATVMDDNQIGEALSGAVAQIKSLLEANATPEVADDLRNGRLAWAKMVRVLDASRRAGGNAFTPGQFASAVAAKESRKDNIGRGTGLMQDIARAARTVLPDQFGNPGSADAGLLAAGAVGAVANPGAAITGAIAATPPTIAYLSMARNIASRVPQRASRTQAENAARELAQLAQQAPPDQAAQIMALRENLLRLGTAGAIALTASGEASARPGPPRREPATN